MAADMAKVVKPRGRVDATASRAIASRRGVGRVRHLKTQVLWVQEAVARRELTIAKVPGCENPSRWGTKHLAEREMHERMRRAGCYTAGERSRLAFEGRKGVRNRASDPAGLRQRQIEHRLKLTGGREHRLRLTQG